MTDLDAPGGAWRGWLHLAHVPAPPTVGPSAVFHAGRGVTGNPNDNVNINAVRAYPLRDGRSTCGPAWAPYFACADWTTPLDGTDATSVVLHPSGAVGYAGCGGPTCGALWSAQAGGAVVGGPAVSSGRLYVTTDAPALVAYTPTPAG